MEDLIKREDAIKAISISCGTCLARDTEDCDKCSVPKLCGLISAIPSADRPSESIGKLIERMEEYRDKQLLMSDYWYGINWAINTIRVSDVADRPQGEWIDMGDFEQCSVCKGTRLKEFQSYYGKVTWIKTPYCPSCGAQMKGADDDTD